MDIVQEDKVLPEFVEWADELASVRREIHQYPETGFDTKQTVARICRVLGEWGVGTVDTETVKGGAIVVIEGSRPGATIAVRADIDALPMADNGITPWKSKVDGKAHACGHDGHQTWLLGVVRYLALHRDFPGRVVAIFQPAEELGKGAAAVVKSGIFKKYGIREIYGAHDEPGLEKGCFGFRAGPLQAASDIFEIRLRGMGTHAARPHNGVDPIPVGCQIVLALQTIVSRRVNPVESAVVSVCSFNAGRIKTNNVVPPDLSMSGTIRTYNRDIRKMIEEKFKRIISNIAAANDCRVDIRFTNVIDAVVNDKALTENAIAVAQELFGKESVVPDFPPLMGGEDFSCYQRVVPGVMLRVGIRDEYHAVSLHNSAFDFNDEVLPAACTLFVKLVESRLNALAA